MPRVCRDICSTNTANRRHWKCFGKTILGSILGHCLRRWHNIKNNTCSPKGKVRNDFNSVGGTCVKTWDGARSVSEACAKFTSVGMVGWYTGCNVNSTRPPSTWSPSHFEKGETRIFLWNRTQVRARDACMPALCQCATSTSHLYKPNFHTYII